MSIGVYAAAGLVMDEVGVYCSWDMPVPGWSTLHHHLHYVPGERSFSVTRVLVVCSACQVLVFVNRRLSGAPVYQLEDLWVQLASQSFLVGPPVVLLVTLQPSLVFSSPSFPRVGSCFPTPFTFLHLAPLSPLFVFCPFTPFLGFPLRVTSYFFLCRFIH